MLFHAVDEEPPSYREIDLTFLNPCLCKENGIYSLYPRKKVELSQEVLMGIFTPLAAKVSNQTPSSKTTTLQLIDLTMIPFNRISFPWAKFRKTKAGSLLSRQGQSVYGKLNYYECYGI